MKNNKSGYSVLTLDGALDDLWFVGDDVRISHYIDCNIAFPEQFKLKDFLVLYLKKGSLIGKMNGEDVTCVAPCLITLSESYIYEYQSSTDDVDAIVLSFSPAFTERLNIFNRFQLNEIFSNNPVLELNDETMKMLETFIQNLTQIGHNPKNPYLSDAVLHLVLYFFYGIGYYYYQIQHSNTRPDQIVDEFMWLLDKFGVEKRNLSFYSNKLRLSTKYIQILVKRVTGRTAHQWIEDALVNEAKRLLAENQYTIQQIADKMKFCDQSYFGAFFKRLTDMTPKAYRDKVLSQANG